MSTEKSEADVSKGLKCGECESSNVFIRKISLVIEHGCLDCGRVHVKTATHYLQVKGGSDGDLSGSLLEGDSYPGQSRR